MATKPGKNSLKDGLRAIRQIVRPHPGPVPTKKPLAAAPEKAIDDGAVFRAAIADVAPLPSDNRVQLAKAPSRRLPPPTRADAPSNTASGKARHEGALPAHWQVADENAPRLPADPDAAAFMRAMSGVAPLPDSNRATLGKPLPAPRPRQFAADEQAALQESLHGPIGLQDRLEGGDEPNHLRAGLANTVLRDLRRGRWVIQAEVDLHGLNRDEARQALAAFLAECLQEGRRCVRVIHGKGYGSPQKLSILRQLVRGWLAQRQEVLAYCQAKPQDGGEGALLVLLRTKPRPA